MLALVLLSGLLGQSAGVAPDVVVKAIDDWRLRVLVAPRDDRTVKAIALELRSAKKTKAERETPHTRVTLPRKQGVCFTFTPVPTERFDVIVTLSDDSVHRIGEKAWRPTVDPDTGEVHHRQFGTHVVESHRTSRRPQFTCF